MYALKAWKGKRNIWSNACQNGLFLLKLGLNVAQCVHKMKQQEYNKYNRVIALVQRIFIFVWANSCIPTHKFVAMIAAVGPYKNKSLNSCDNP